jgi:hypothetical protein
MNQQSLRFVPSKVEGLPDVTEIIVHSDRLDFLTTDRTVVIRFFDIAQWPRPKGLWRFLFRIGRRPSWLPVGDRDWFHPPHERFFRFYTQPSITVYMPGDEVKDYQESYFWRVQQVMWRGGFSTCDMG